MSDLIDRQSAIDMLSLGKEILSRVLDDIDVVGTDREKYSWGLELIESNIKDIEELLSAQPEPKKGKWINYDSDSEISDDIRCSCCQKLFTVDTYHFTDIGFTVDDLKYCPNCGADMR